MASSGPRPSSSLSNNRPPSSTSSRPISRLSTRTNSRRARSRLTPLAQALVRQVTGFSDSKDGAGPSHFRESVDFVVKNLEATTLSKGAVSVGMGVIDEHIKGLALKARLNIQDDIAEALEVCYSDLKGHIEDQQSDLDDEIQRSHIPDHLQFLLKLSAAPTEGTRLHASSYLYNRANPPPPPEPLTWATIVAEEPFEGEHWEGVYGLPPGFIRQSHDPVLFDLDSGGSTPSLSPLKSDDLDFDTEDDVPFDRLGEPSHGADPYVHDRAHTILDVKNITKVQVHKTLEALQAKQYWKDGWKGDKVVTGMRNFDMKDASTFGLALSSILCPTNFGTSYPALVDTFIESERYINEEDVIREIMMAFQGRRNAMLEWQVKNPALVEGKYMITSSTPRVLHLSLGSQSSILNALGEAASTVHRLRHFVQRIYEDIQRKPPTRQSQVPTWQVATEGTRTREAFADAIDQEIKRLEAWCASREEVMCKTWSGIPTSSSEAGDGRLVISLLGTEKDIRDTFERTFDVLSDLATLVYSFVAARQRHISPAATSAKLLNRLFESVQEHLERRERVTSEALMRVFVRTVEPIWGMIGRWLRDGMGPGAGLGAGTAGELWELEEEFFIESSGLGFGMMGRGLLDPDFWKEGYALREAVVFEEGQNSGDVKERRQNAVPLFLENVADIILSVGKAIGLLRALGVPLSSIAATDGTGDWPSFARLVGPFSAIPGEGNRDFLFSVSIDTLSRLIYDRLSPRCKAAHALLVRVLVQDCKLFMHLESIEGLFLHKKGDAVCHFAEILFAKMDAQQSWGDFHFINTAFNDVLEVSNDPAREPWIQASLVRLYFRGGSSKEKAAQQTVKALDGLGVEYAVPFPLTYILQPTAINAYGEIFIFLLQIRRAKSVLERALVQRAGKRKILPNETKVFYAMGSRLNWVINTLLDFLTTYVIQSRLITFHKAFRKAQSLDDFAQLHDDHLDYLQNRCFLKANTASLHRAIISILDMAIHFSVSFIALTGETTMPEHSRSMSVSIRRHRSRRQRKQQRNIVSFSGPLLDFQDSSEDEDDDEYRDIAVPDVPYAMDASMSFEDGALHGRMETMSKELDILVRFLRRGAENLAGESGEFGILAFSLQDWDI